MLPEPTFCDISIHELSSVSKQEPQVSAAHTLCAAAVDLFGARARLTCRYLSLQQLARQCWSSYPADPAPLCKTLQQHHAAISALRRPRYIRCIAVLEQCHHVELYGRVLDIADIDALSTPPLAALLPLPSQIDELLLELSARIDRQLVTEPIDTLIFIFLSGRAPEVH